MIERKSLYLDTLKQRVLVFDGAFGTTVLDRNLGAAEYGGVELIGCNDHLPMSYPELVREIHASFFEVGCDVIETFSFQASRLKLDEWGLGEKTLEINRTAAQIAREVADRWSTPERPRFVAGSIGPTGMLPSTDDPSLGRLGFDELADVLAEQAQGLVEGGVDLLVIETQQDLLETKAAIAGAWRYFRRSGRWVPIQAQVSLLDTSGTMLLGTDIGAVLATLEALPVDLIGLNCSTGPELMRDGVRYLSEHCTRPISVIPNAGIPLNENGRAIYPGQPGPMAEILGEFVDDFGVSVVGGCCGTTPEHIRQLVRRVGGRAPKRRTIDAPASLASAIRAYTLHQDPPPLIVGERVNATGSRKVKRLLLKDDYDGILQVAREQVEGGAHALDVSVAVTERPDELEQMRRLVKKLQMSVETPLVIDSTEPEVQIAALKMYPGRAIVNSINLENREQRIDRVIPAVVEHGAAVIAQTIDETGMAKTGEEKARIAARITEILTKEYGLAQESIIFDDLVFPITTGDSELARAGLETLDGIRRIKATLPGVSTILGVSNLSFGISPHARAVLNSVFLYHAVEAGLDLAIVNPAHITPYAEVPEEERALADDLIFNRRPDALARYIQYFEVHGPAEAEETEDPSSALTAEERIHYQILHRKKDGIEALLDEAMRRHDPVWVLNNVLLPAMKDVGDRFGAGELILPFVLQSAEVMKRAVAHLEQFLDKQEGVTKGKVVIATVFGDVHDIGKNLVGTILSNNGYTVIDLGKQVPITRIIDSAIELEADAIGLSALLVSTSKQMPLCVQELHRRGLQFPVIIGGAAINRAFGRRTLFAPSQARSDGSNEGVNEGIPYGGGVFYAKDAFEGLEIVDKLTDPTRREDFVDQIIDEGFEELRRAQAGPSTVQDAGSERSASVRADATIPRPPFWGVRALDTHEIPLDEIFACMDLNTLFRLHWGGKVHGAEYERLLDEDFRPRLERMQREARERGDLQPRAVYGYFPVNSDGNDLIVFDPAQQDREIARFAFPRQPSRERLCLADYFAPLSSGRRDVAGFQVVTMGERPTEVVDALQARGEYSEAYFLHGLAVEAAEGLAEWLQQRIRRELGLGEGQGKRYSWGYPACPDLEQHLLVRDLLHSERRIGVAVTPGYQLVPEQSTAALVVHHPQAKYYSTSVSEPAASRRSIAVAGGD
jgi:5-methyltetrahydrofolate--homocysteine methyltransferase